MDEKMSVYFCSGKFRKGHLEQIFNYDIASMEMINKEQNLLQVIRVQSEGNLLSFEFFSVHMLKKNRWKFNAFFPYQLWNFILYYQG